MTNLEVDAMKLAMAAQIREQILGIFGKDDDDECRAKLHGMVQLSESMKLDDTLNVTISIKELVKARDEYLKHMEDHPEETE